MTKERAIEIIEELYELQMYCLNTKGDSTSYQICRLLREIVRHIVLESK